MSEIDQHAGQQRFLRKLKSIAEISPQDEQALLGLPMSVRSYPARHDLVRDKERPPACHLILDGFACCHKSLADGRRQILSFHTPGDVPDLQGLHLETMDYGVSTLAPTVVGHVSLASLHDLTRRHLGIAHAFWRDTVIDGAIFREWMLGLGRRTVRERISHMLCEMALRFEAVGLAGDDRAYEMPTTHTDLGDALGLTVVHVGRVLQELRQEGLIMFEAATLRVLDFDGLARICDFDPAYLHQDRRA